jgi:carbamoyl-phosphate synthase large subunit
VEEILRVESGDAEGVLRRKGVLRAADGGWADGAESGGRSGGFGVLEKFGVELIGAKLEAIKKAEDRLLFKDAMNKIGLDMPKSQLVNNTRWAGVCGKIGFRW